MTVAQLGADAALPEPPQTSPAAPRQHRRLALPLLIAVLVGVGIGVGVAALTLEQGTKVYTAFSQDLFSKPRTICCDVAQRPATADRPAQPASSVNVPIHTISFLAHGGEARVEWYDGAWTPLKPRSGSYVSIYIDGKRRASALLGGRTGRFESRPGNLVWLGRLAPGRRRIQVIVERVDRGYAVPFADRQAIVPDSLSVVEYTR